MNKKPETTVEDVLMAVNDLATLMGEQLEDVRNDIKDSRAETNERFQQVDHRFDAIDSELHGVRHEQREMRVWLESIENHILGIESDIKEIYDQIVILEQKAPYLTRNEHQELAAKLEVMITWAQKVSQKTGIPLPKI